MFFSVPFYFKDAFIDFLVTQNNKDTRYKIKRVYNSLSYWSTEDYSGFEYFKSFNNTDPKLNKTTFDDLKKYVDRLRKENIEYIYAMNIATPYSSNKFNELIPRLDNFINRLREIGIKYISVANQMLADHINRTHPDMNIGISTMLHTDSIEKARLFKQLFSNIEYMIPCIDINKDFEFLRTFNKMLPNVSLELMANEGCLFSCPTKNLHYVTFGMTRENQGITVTKKYPSSVCNRITNEDAFLQVVIGKTIFPWEIPTYEELGLSSIKLVGRDNAYDLTTKQIETYMTGSTDPEKIMDKYLVDVVPFISTRGQVGASHIVINYITLRQFREYLPSNDYFIKVKPNCRTGCEAQCNYCYNQARKLEAVGKQL